MYERPERLPTLPGFDGWPRALPLPDLLRDLLAWDPVGRRLPFGLEVGLNHLDLGMCNDDRAWFESQAPRLGAFLAESDGSWYGLWDDGRGHAPVVFVSSDGDPNGIVAASLEDFVRLLAVGYHGPRLKFHELTQDPPSASDLEDNDLTALRAWVQDRLGATIPPDGREVRRRVEHANLGDFDAWLARTYGWTDEWPEASTRPLPNESPRDSG